MEKSFIDLYLLCEEQESTECFDGVCVSNADLMGSNYDERKELINLFRPIDEPYGYGFWLRECNDWEQDWTFNDLRKTVVLLCAAMNGEML